VLVSSPHTLKQLHSRGYKTFDGIIDESYDQIINDGDRMLAIVKEVKRLCSLQGKDLENFLTAAKEICEHNFQVLSTLKFEDYIQPYFNLP